jgi:integrase
MPLPHNERSTYRDDDEQWLVEGAQARAGLTPVRVHDLEHTLGRRLRAAGLSFEDRQDLVGHRSGRITTTTLPRSWRT